jgi:predicted kinase
MAMPTLYLFVGFPGSGKTTAAEIICKLTGATHIWADRERQKMFGRPTHSLAESGELYKALNLKTRSLLRAGHDVVFDTNFNYRADRKRLGKIAESAGAATVIIQMVTPPALARERALAWNHADRNGMHREMSSETYERIVKHREPLANEMTPIRLDGRNLTEASVKKALGLK